MKEELYPEELTQEESEYYDFKLFEGDSFKEDYDKALKYAEKHKGQVYTMVDGDDDKTYYLKGLHYVNRFAFCVLKKSFDRENIISTMKETCSGSLSFCCKKSCPIKNNVLKKLGVTEEEFLQLKAQFDEDLFKLIKGKLK